jgi:hypothetical protein
MDLRLAVLLAPAALGFFAGTADAKPTPFDRAAAAAALGRVELSHCKVTNSPRGEGHVKLTFEPGGTIKEAVVDGGPFVGSPVAGCIASAFKKIRVPAYDGSAVVVGKTFSIR